jgi:hypothetical protein
MDLDLEERGNDNYRNQMLRKIIHYDKERYLELLSKKSVNTNLPREELYELMGYSALLEIQITWISRSKYYPIIEEFLKEDISRGDFFHQFFEREELNGEILSILESNLVLFCPKKSAVYFTELINKIYFQLETFDFYDDEENAENVLKNSIKEDFL